MCARVLAVRDRYQDRDHRFRDRGLLDLETETSKLETTSLVPETKNLSRETRLLWSLGLKKNLVILSQCRLSK